MDADRSNSQRPACPDCEQRDRRIAELEARNAELEGRNARLECRLGQTEKRLKQLEEMLNKQQRGAKRQAAPFSKGPPKADPKKPGRKSGPDYGTKARRAVPPVIHEEHQAKLPNACPHCGGSDLQLEEMAEQYQTEIPKDPIQRKFNIEVGRCGGCQRRVQGRHELQTSDALGAASSQIGPRAQALIVHLNKDAGLSHGKIARFFQTTFGIQLSRGGACQAMQRAARRCENESQRIVAHIQQSDTVTGDETGWRIGGQNAWLHAAATTKAIAYLIDRRRGYEAMRKLLGDDFAGILSRDGWEAYRRFLHALHQLCLAHLLRRCRAMLEVATRGAVVFPRRIKALLTEALEIRDQRDAGRITPAAAVEMAEALQERIVKLTTPTKTNPANERLAKHLYRNQDYLFTFLRHEGVEATNWRAEQAIRPAVVNRKVWGGNRTEAGAHAQSILMTICQTARLNAVDLLDWLSQLLCSPDATRHLVPEPPP